MNGPHDPAAIHMKRIRYQPPQRGAALAIIQPEARFSWAAGDVAGGLIQLQKKDFLPFARVSVPDH